MKNKLGNKEEINVKLIIKKNLLRKIEKRADDLKLKFDEYILYRLISDNKLIELKENFKRKISKDSEEIKKQKSGQILYLDRRSIEKQVEEGKDLNNYFIKHLELMEVYLD